MAIVWGSVAGSGSGQARIGIALSTSSTDTKTTVTAKCYFWSKYAVTDSSNTFYANWASSATTSKGAISIKTTNNSGSGWSTDNQKLIATYTKTVTRTSSSQTVHMAIKLTGIDAVGATMTAHTTTSVPALPTVSLTLDNNGHGNVQAGYIVTKGSSVTLPNATAMGTVTGYTFGGWNTKKNGSGTTYSGGSKYTVNANTTLYAVWTPKVYTITLKQYSTNFNNVLSSSHPPEKYGNYYSTIYEKYGVGFYTDSACTKKITKVLVPTLTISYTVKGTTPNNPSTSRTVSISGEFLGYYNSSHSIELANGAGTLQSTKAFSSNTTVYAEWYLRQLVFPYEFGNIINNYKFVCYEGDGYRIYDMRVPYGYASPTSTNILTCVWSDLTSVYYKDRDKWKRGFIYCKQGGEWKGSQTVGLAPYIKVGGQWKISGDWSD